MIADSTMDSILIFLPCLIMDGYRNKGQLKADLYP